MQPKISSALTAFIADRKGVSAMEYALIAALVGVVIIGSVATLGTQASSTLNSVNNSLTSSTGTSTTDTGSTTTTGGTTTPATTGTGPGPGPAITLPPPPTPRH